MRSVEDQSCSFAMGEQIFWASRFSVLTFRAHLPCPTCSGGFCCSGASHGPHGEGGVSYISNRKDLSRALTSPTRSSAAQASWALQSYYASVKGPMCLADGGREEEVDKRPLLDHFGLKGARFGSNSSPLVSLRDLLLNSTNGV